MKISKQEVEHVAKLARLELSEQEKETLTDQLSNILTYVEKLNELDTDGIEPMSHAVPMENAFRADEVKPSIGIGCNADSRDSDISNRATIAIGHRTLHRYWISMPTQKIKILSRCIGWHMDAS